MSEASERTLLLLQELAILKEAEQQKKKGKTKIGKRRKEITDEIRKIAAEKEQSTN